MNPSPAQNAPHAPVLLSEAPRRPLIHFLVLLALAVLAIRSEWKPVIYQIVRESEAAHAWAIPLLIALMAWRRRAVLKQSIRQGSLWGVALIAIGLLIFTASSWPFNYGYPKRFTFIPLVAGAILSAAGWRTLRYCLPMLLLLTVAMPLGYRHFAFLVIRPETFTLAAAEKILDILPGVFMTLEGPDLHFLHDGAKGVVALGDANRGASLFLSSLTIGLFVTFIAIRPLWQIVAVAILAAPIILLCNLLRLLLHSVLTIYGGATPLDAWPRNTAYACSLVLAYISFVVLIGLLNRILVTPTPAPNEISK